MRIRIPDPHQPPYRSGPICGSGSRELTSAWKKCIHSLHGNIRFFHNINLDTIINLILIKSLILTYKFLALFWQPCEDFCLLDPGGLPKCSENDGENIVNQTFKRCFIVSAACLQASGPAPVQIRSWWPDPGWLSGSRQPLRGPAEFTR